MASGSMQRFETEHPIPIYSILILYLVYLVGHGLNGRSSCLNGWMDGHGWQVFLLEWLEGW